MHEPERLVPLATWLDAADRGAPPCPLDPYEAVGFVLTDGSRTLRSESWGGASDIADGCRHVVERLQAGQTALFRSSDVGSPVYLWFRSARRRRAPGVG